MVVEVKWTLYAIEDIEKIAEYISRDSHQYAQLQVEKFFERVLLLENFPNAGRIVPELKQNNIRELIEGNYRIIYRIVSDSRIDVLAVHHARMLLSDNPYTE